MSSVSGGVLCLWAMQVVKKCKDGDVSVIQDVQKVTRRKDWVPGIAFVQFGGTRHQVLFCSSTEGLGEVNAHHVSVFQR